MVRLDRETCRRDAAPLEYQVTSAKGPASVLHHRPAIVPADVGMASTSHFITVASDDGGQALGIVAELLSHSARMRQAEAGFIQNDLGAVQDISTSGRSNPANEALVGGELNWNYKSARCSICKNVCCSLHCLQLPCHEERNGLVKT